MRAVPRNRLHSVDPLSDRESSLATLAGGDDRARKVVAKRHRKSRGSCEREQPPAIAVGATHVDRIYRRGVDRNLNLIRRRNAARDFTDLKPAACLRRATHGDKAS